LPLFPVIAAAAALHAAASCVLGPCIVAMSLGLVGHAAIGERLGRNARFASIGNGIAAGVMGGVGYLLSPRWVFVVTALLLLRALLFATVTDPAFVLAVQVLDGITASTLGIMVPLMVADITRGTGRFNLAQGIVGTAVGIGASISPTLAGYLTDHFSSSVAFLGLAAIASLGLAALWLLMPETRLRRE